ncbi:MAG: acyltransferase [Betaproteobacteria bacterium]|nr:acyltransferase [Betaproteobacteria bacterium]
MMQPANSASAATEPQLRFEGLDVLRGLAALYVMLSHYTSYSLRKFGGTPFLVARETGEYAVWLFFMISGFVIFFSLERSRTWVDFAVSRATRLYPAYWATLCLVVVLEVWWFRDHVFWPGAFLTNLTMFQEYLGFPNIDDIYWTLTIELAFYVWIALLFRAGCLHQVETWCAVWLLLAWIVVAAERWTGFALPAWAARVLILPYMPLFIIGIMTYLNRLHGFNARRVAIIGACLATVWAVMGLNHFIAAAPLAALAAFAVSPWGRILACAPLLWLGTISYSLYLVHHNLGYLLLSDLHRRGLGTAAALVFTIALAIVLAAAVTFLIERPVCAWLRERYRARVSRLTR